MQRKQAIIRDKFCHLGLMELQYSHGRVFWEARNPNFLRPSFEAKAELESRLNSNKIRIWGSYGGSLFGEAQLEIRVCMTQSISSAHNAGPSVNPAHACFFRIKIFIFTELKVETGAAGKSDRRQNGRRGESCHPEVGKPQPRSAQRLGQPEKGKKN